LSGGDVDEQKETDWWDFDPPTWCHECEVCGELTIDDEPVCEVCREDE